MRRILFSFGLVAAVIGIAFAIRALGASEVTVALHEVPSAYVSGGYPDALGLDVTMTAPRGDVLDAIIIRQDGTAQWLRDLTDAKLWTDEGPSGFQGIGVDRMLARGSWDANDRTWAFVGMWEPVRAAGSRFFVTTSTHQNPTANTTIQLSIPGFLDMGSPMAYDAGDRGIFLRTARPAPAAAVANANTQTIATATTDGQPPVIRITEPGAGVSLQQNWFVVRGVAQDRGGSATARVQVGVNRVGRAITWVDAVPEATGFTTWEARFFELPVPASLELRVKGEDWIGNRMSESAPITVELK